MAEYKGEYKLLVLALVRRCWALELHRQQPSLYVPPLDVEHLSISTKLTPKQVELQIARAMAEELILSEGVSIEQPGLFTDNYVIDEAKVMAVYTNHPDFERDRRRAAGALTLKGHLTIWASAVALWWIISRLWS